MLDVPIGMVFQGKVHHTRATIAGTWLAWSASTGCSDAAILVPLEERGQVAEPAPPFVRVWPLGDSITYGQGGFPDTEGYRKRVWEWAQSRGFTGLDFVGTSPIGEGFDADQNGHPGATTADTWLRVATVYESGKVSDVDLAILLIGTNDLATYDPVQTPAVYEDLLRRLAAVDTATNVMVTTIPPSRDYQAGADAFNAALPPIWDRFETDHGPRLLYVDLSAAFGSVWSPELFSDHSHPSNAGYDRIAAAMEGPLLAWLLAR